MYFYLHVLCNTRTYYNKTSALCTTCIIIVYRTLTNTLFVYTHFAVFLDPCYLVVKQGHLTVGYEWQITDAYFSWCLHRFGSQQMQATKKKTGVTTASTKK